MLYEIELTRKEAEELLKDGAMMARSQNVCPYDHEDDQQDFIEFEGLCFFRGKVFVMSGGRPDYTIDLDKKAHYVVYDHIIEGKEEEVLNKLLLEEMLKPSDEFHCLDHQVRVNKDSLEVGCQHIDKKDAVGIANYILRLWGEE